MAVKVYVSGMSGNKEVKKRQQRVLMILDSKNIKYEVIDITEPGRDADKEFMQNNSKSNGGTVSDPNPRHALPPQVFNDDEYCGDYDLFDMANEVDTLEQFLKLEVPPEETPQDENKENILNGDTTGKISKENSQERSASKEGTPGKDGTPTKEGTPDKGTSSREATPAKDKVASKEPTPAKDEIKESTPAKEDSPMRQKSVEEETSAKKSKESSPEVNENGTASSRASAEKEAAGDAAVDSKKDPSEVLIASEQEAAAE